MRRKRLRLRRSGLLLRRGRTHGGWLTLRYGLLLSTAAHRQGNANHNRYQCRNNKQRFLVHKRFPLILSRG
jgi:hypothetical protein